MRNLRDFSRGEWLGIYSDDKPDCQEIATGALQRIADATEKMAASYDMLRGDRDWWKERAECRWTALRSAQRSNSALRSVITKLKAKKEGKS